MWTGIAALLVVAVGAALFLVLNKPSEPEQKKERVYVDGEVKTYTINEENPTVKTDEYTIEMPASTLDGDETLTVQRIDPRVPVGTDGEHCLVYEVNLGDKHELEGVAKITLPFRQEKSNSMLCAGYLNPETNEWEPVDWSYRDGEALIRTDHLSQFGIFEVIEDNSSTMRFMRFLMDPAGEIRHELEAQIVEHMQELINSDGYEAETIDKAADWYGTISQFGMDMGYNVIKSLGYENAFLEKFGDELGMLGVMFTTWQIARYAHEGKDIQVSSNSLKLISNFWSGKILSFVGTQVAYGCMAGIAVFDYAMTKFMEHIISDRNQQYKNMYLAYYKDHPWKDREWHRRLWPIFTDTSLSAEQVHDAVTELVDGRVGEFWEDWENPDKSHVVEYYDQYSKGFDGKSSMNSGLGGGLNQGVIDEISNWYRTHLYETVVSNVMKEIAEKLRAKNFKSYKKALVEVARSLNQWIEFDIEDVDAVDGKSELEDYVVRFRGLPERVSDKENWQAVLDSRGHGKIRVINFAYIYQNIQPVLQLVDPDGKVVKEIPYTVGVPKTEIKLTAKEQPGLPAEMLGRWTKYWEYNGKMNAECILTPTHITIREEVKVNPHLSSGQELLLYDRELQTTCDADYIVEQQETRTRYDIKLIHASNPDFEGKVVNIRMYVHEDEPFSLSIGGDGKSCITVIQLKKE